MNAHACRLPGERELYPGEPNVRLRQLGGPVTLEAFRLIHEEDRLSWQRDMPWAFTVALLRRSKVRRINAGTNKLLIEAARDTLKTFERALHRMYAKRGWLSYLPDELADRLACELAAEAKGEQAIRSQTAEFLKYIRDSIATDEALSYMPRQIVAIGTNEAVEETYSRWMDFFEYVKKIGKYVLVLDLHRSVVCCARVHDAVFGSSILHFSRD